jgi:licheninase
MHLCVQLDWFPEDGAGEVQESQMHVDWVKQYPLPGAGEGEPLREGAPDPDRVLRSAQRAPSGI